MHLDLAFNLKKYLACCLTLLLACGATRIFAQKTNEPNELDKKYEPKGSVFSSEQLKKNKNSDSYSDVRYGIKFMPFQLLYRNVAIENEITLGRSNVTLLLGIGYNFAASNYNNSIGLFSGSSYATDLNVKTAVTNGRYQKGGPFVMGGMKFYVTEFRNIYSYYASSSSNAGTPFQNLYNYIRICYFNYHYYLDPVINGYPISGSRDYKIDVTKFLYGIGGSLVTGQKVKLIHDFYLGVGIKLLGYPDFTTEYIYSSTNGSDPVYRAKGRDSDIGFALEFGYAIGFGF